MAISNSPTEASNSRHELIIQKYGGATLATPEKIKQVALRIAKRHKQHGPFVVVVSAMGSTTNELLQLSKAVAHHPTRREVDMLISVGERISMSLMSMALNDLGCQAVSLTGSQAGIITSENFSNATIEEIKPQRVLSLLSEGKVVILAGFQGVSATTKEVTTLGRGGSDLTAVAMAAALNASRCEILKEVDGVFSADPKICPQAKHLEKINISELSDMSFWGAKVLNYRSSALAEKFQIPLWIGSSEKVEVGTMVLVNEKEKLMKFEGATEFAVNSFECVLKATCSTNSIHGALKLIEDLSRESQIPSPQHLATRTTSEGVQGIWAGPKEDLEQLFAHLQQKKISSSLEFCLVTVTSLGGELHKNEAHLLEALSKEGITPNEVLRRSKGISFLMPSNQRSLALQVLTSSSK